jgi:hypothetical protein
MGGVEAHRNLARLRKEDAAQDSPGETEKPVSKKAKGINPDLEKAISDLLKQVMADPTATLTDKTKVIDRALNLEKVKQRMESEEWGSGFLPTDDDE